MKHKSAIEDSEYVIALSSASDDPDLITEIEVDGECIAVVSRTGETKTLDGLCIELLPSATKRRWPLGGFIQTLQRAAAYLTKGSSSDEGAVSPTGPGSVREVQKKGWSR